MATNHDPNDLNCQCVDCRARRRSQQIVASAVGPGATSTTLAQREFASLRVAGNFATIFLMAFGVLLVITIISNFMEISLLQSINVGAVVTIEEANSNDRRQQVVGILYLVGFIVTAIVFWAWIHRASSNLYSLGLDEQQHSPGWAIACWIIPVISLFRPYQIMKEIWKGSYPKIEGNSRGAWDDAPVSHLMGFWWATFLIGSWVAKISSRVFFSDNATIDQYITGNWFAIISDVIWLVSLILIVVLVRQITNNQERKFEAYGESISAERESLNDSVP